MTKHEIELGQNYHKEITSLSLPFKPLSHRDKGRGPVTASIVLNLDILKGTGFPYLQSPVGVLRNPESRGSQGRPELLAACVAHGLDEPNSGQRVKSRSSKLNW